ncbi:MAG: tripartite tricarboxylate transporter permease [archaeon]
MLTLILCLLGGLALGVLTGLIPGIHSNTVNFLLLSLVFFPGIELVVLIVGMTVTQSFVDFIPSIFFGAPDSDSFLALLPGHRLLLQGLGLKAVQLTVAGGLVAGILSVALLPAFYFLVKELVLVLSYIIPSLLLITIFLMISSEKSWKKKFYAITVILLSGLLGLIVLQGKIELNNALFPLITGLFASPALIYSLKEKTIIRKQLTNKNYINSERVLKYAFLSSIAGGLVSLFPALGPNQAAFLLRKLIGKIRTSSYLILLGGINTTNLVFGFFVLFFLGKTRTGASAAIKQLIPLNQDFLAIIIFTVLISLAFGAVITIWLGKIIAVNIHKLNYQKINFIVLIFLTLIIAVLTGFNGLMVYVTATAIGLLPISTNIKRTHAMACLMIPTIIIYLL